MTSGPALDRRRLGVFVRSGSERGTTDLTTTNGRTRSSSATTMILTRKKTAPSLGPPFKRGKRKEVRKGDARGQSGGRFGIE